MSQKKLAVYLDVSAIGRLFDDQSQLRVRLETDAVRLILANIADGVIQLAASDALESEIQANPTLRERHFIQTLYQSYAVRITISPDEIRKRVQILDAFGISAMDALHVATAEAGKHDFITCDDRLLNQISRSDVRIWCGNPVAFCAREELR